MNSERIARAGGWASVIAGVFGAAAAVVLIFIPPAVPETVFSHPLTPEGHLLVQVVFGVHHFVAAYGLWAFWRAGLGGTGRLANITGIGSTVVFALFGVWEIVVGAFGGEPYPTPTTDVIDGVYGTLSLLIAVLLVLFGVAAARARVLGPVTRWFMLGFGVFLIVPGLPLLSMGFVVGRLVIAAWLLILALVGWTMLQWSAQADERIVAV
ncbi:hypothetical protein [Microbacterium sp.]|uniref:hypothetical protein n=1 Tax=Microbacterium sp. TaxID=51671 RepID=UPI003C779CAC